MGVFHYSIRKNNVQLKIFHKKTPRVSRWLFGSLPFGYKTPEGAVHFDEPLFNRARIGQINLPLTQHLSKYSLMPNCLGRSELVEGWNFLENSISGGLESARGVRSLHHVVT